MTSRIFLDASALFAAAYAPTGATREILRLGMEGAVHLFTNQVAIEDAERNLTRKAPEGVAIVRALLVALPIQVSPAPDADAIATLLPLVVAKDAPILAGALACQADYLATFDRQHLIGIDVATLSTSLVIATPGDILNHLRAEG